MIEEDALMLDGEGWGCEREGLICGGFDAQRGMRGVGWGHDYH
jgi:hypothetical protein